MKRLSLNKGLAFCLVLILGSFAAQAPHEKYFEIAKNLDIFATLIKEVNAYYVDEVNPNRMVKTGIDAMLNTLDPYTNYIPEDEIENYRTMTTGMYGGIGAVIGRRKDRNIVLMPYNGFPADKAGLKIGDEIQEIDGFDVRKKNSNDVSKLLKGQAGTKVKLRVLKLGKTEPTCHTLAWLQTE
jgi:carboxyl-terminal processing protease